MNLRTGRTHFYRSAAQFRAVYRSYRPLRFSVAAHLDKRKASRLIRFEIGHHLEPLDFAVLFKYGTNILFSSAGIEVSNKNVIHNGAFPYRCRCLA
jgi:hypothetical protein